MTDIMIKEVCLYPITSVEPNPMRIGILGAHGVGKTTLCNELASELKLPLINEIAREVHRFGFGLDQNGDYQTQVAIWLQQLKEELQYDSFVTDRTIIDSSVYLSVLVDGSRAKYFLDLLEALTLSFLANRYTHIFYIPIEFDLVADGVRNEDSLYQKVIDKAFISYLRKYNYIYTVLRGSLTERLAQALKALP